MNSKDDYFEIFVPESEPELFAPPVNKIVKPEKITTSDLIAIYKLQKDGFVPSDFEA